ncbi:MAG: ATP-binding protein [Deltaproteobacteria bacterium]|nr:ATP-binding protein [Deltaproteobacteria bacterium]
MNTKNPYPGLRPFHRDEADIFFGRDSHIADLLEMLPEKRFLAIIGASGAGKSSLIKAGMIPALKAGFMLNTGSHWKIAEMQPGDRPFERLAEAVFHSLIKPQDNTASHDTKQEIAGIASDLRCGPRSLVNILRKQFTSTKENILLLVDQFEELFRYSTSNKGAPLKDAEAFIALLLETAGELEVPLYIVVTMRAEYIGECSQFQNLAKILSRSMYVTPMLTREQLQEAIIGPARMFDSDVEPELLNDLLNEIDRKQDDLPILQHALMRVWSKVKKTSEKPILTLSAYDKIGRMKDAVNRHAEEIYEKLDENQQNIATEIFCILSDSTSPGKDMRRPSLLRDIVAQINASLKTGVSFKDVRAVIDFFRKPECGFIVPGPDQKLNENDMIDLSHESLLRIWHRLKYHIHCSKQPTIWSEEKIKDWMKKKSYEISERRAVEWHSKLPVHRILELYSNEFPAQMDDHLVSDWHHAELYLAADVLDGRTKLDDNFEPTYYSEIENIWLQEVKELKAYFNWKKDGHQGYAENYWKACEELRNMLTGFSRKVNSIKAFEPIKQHIRRYQTDGTEKNNLLNAKISRLRPFGLSAEQSNRIAEEYVTDFYGKITDAATTGEDKNATCSVLHALGFCPNGPNDDSSRYNNAIVNCFEMTISIQFLNANLVDRILTTG